MNIKKLAKQIIADMLIEKKNIPEKGDIVAKVDIKDDGSHLVFISFESGKEIVCRFDSRE